MFYAYGKDKQATIPRIELWNRIRERTGKVKKELSEFPSIREEALYLWHMYCDIRRGCEKVTFESLAAFQQVTKVQLEQWESLLMLDIDKARLEDG